MKRHLILLIAVLALIGSSVLADDTRCLEDAGCESANQQDINDIAQQPNPKSDVTPLTVNEDLLHDRHYQQVTGALDVFDGPGGNHLYTLSEGFNFVTSMESIDGWTQIKPGHWVKSDQLKTTNYIVSEFTGVQLPEEPLPFPMAWMLVNVYPSDTPGGSPLESNGLLPRYTRIYIYETAYDDEGWRWYEVEEDKWVHQTQVAKILPIERPETVSTDHWISIDLYEQVMIAYEGERPVFATLVSSGLPRWPTYEGTFNIYWRRLRDDMSWGTPGDDFYFLEEVPWTMFFDEGRALHGAYWHDGFGYRRSHGCVNLSITDAHWLYQWVADEMGSLASADIEEGPAVYVYSSGEYTE